jgi:UDP-3-O-[3-hydroxymyristoyl] N-acetylglucosamine deacetylase
MDLTPDAYRREIGAARTFGFMSDVEYLKRSGLIRGGSLDNAVVLDESGIVNKQLRYPDEFVRHKLLDLLGDISLVGHPIVGHLFAEKAGHAIHTALADQIARSTAKYRVCTLLELDELQTDKRGAVAKESHLRKMARTGEPSSPESLSGRQISS